MQEAGMQRVVEPQLGAQPRYCFRVGAFTHHLQYRVTGGNEQQQKGDNGYAKKCGDCQQQSPRYEG
jgi:hypothetical protein